MKIQAADIISILDLEPHPEGGFFRETYRSGITIPEGILPAGFTGPRHTCTAIYYLLRGTDCSMFHRIRSDEIWHYYAGTTILIHMLGGAIDTLATRRLGPDPAAGDSFQVVVPAGTWFAAEPLDQSEESFALAGCTVAPGFDFRDFEMADPVALCSVFPEHSGLVRRLSIRH